MSNKIDYGNNYTDRELEVILALLEKAVGDLNANPMFTNNIKSLKSIEAVEYVRDRTKLFLSKREGYNG